MQRIRGMVYTDRWMFGAGEIAISGDTIEEMELCEESQLTEEEAGHLSGGAFSFYGEKGRAPCDASV